MLYDAEQVQVEKNQMMTEERIIRKAWKVQYFEDSKFFEYTFLLGHMI